MGSPHYCAEKLLLGDNMDEKELNRRIAIGKKATEKMLADKLASDRATHSEHKLWNYDPKTGQLVDNGGK